jgi:hypothetical protein
MKKRPAPSGRLFISHLACACRSVRTSIDRAIDGINRAETSHTSGAARDANKYDGYRIRAQIVFIAS